jgi:hypothetical protein
MIPFLVFSASIKSTPGNDNLPIGKIHLKRLIYHWEHNPNYLDDDKYYARADLHDWDRYLNRAHATMN